MSLSHSPGHGQADFGEALAVIGGVERKAHLFAFDLPHSDICYVRAYPAATTEAWLDGHVDAFAFFGAVPRSILYDNDRCLVAKIMPDGTRQTTRRFSTMLSHYVIRDRSGRPGKGNGFVSQMVYDRDSRRDSITVAVWNERLDPDDMEDPEPVCLSSLPEAARLPCDPV